MTQVKTLLANYRKADPKKYELVIKVHEACTKETDKDECVAIIKIMNCIEQENNKANKANQTNKVQQGLLTTNEKILDNVTGTGRTVDTKMIK